MNGAPRTAVRLSLVPLAHARQRTFAHISRCVRLRRLAARFAHNAAQRQRAYAQT